LYDFFPGVRFVKPDKEKKCLLHGDINGNCRYNISAIAICDLDAKGVGLSADTTIAHFGGVFRKGKERVLTRLVTAASTTTLSELIIPCL
jgi:hypothetical protein